MKNIYLIHFFSIVIISMAVAKVGEHIQEDYVWGFSQVIIISWALLIIAYGSYFLGKTEDE